MKVAFCGHRTVADKEAVESWLISVCTDLILQGAEEFLLGGYGEFDALCAGVLRKLKEKHPPICLTLVLPYINTCSPVEAYDEIVYPPLESVPRRFAISRRNEWMVQRSDVLVAYVVHDWGGAAKMLAYAQRRKKTICLFG